MYTALERWQRAFPRRRTLKPQSETLNCIRRVIQIEHDLAYKNYYTC